jgi:hypothetical protein
MGKQDGLGKEVEQIRQATVKARQRLEEKGSVCWRRSFGFTVPRASGSI